MGGGLAYYAAANVMLDVDDKDQIEKDLPSQLPVGALCLIDDQPRDPDTFTEEDRATLRDFAQMIARELTLGHEQRRRETETKQSNFLGEFLNTAIILPDKATAESTRSRTTNLQPSTSDNPSVPSAPGAKASPATQAVLAPTLPPTTAPETTFNVAASNLKDLTSATSSAIIDLRSFRSPVFDDDRKSPSAPPQQRQSNGDLGGRGKLYLIGHAGGVKWEDVMAQESLMDAVADVLTEYHAVSGVDPFLRFVADPCCPFKVVHGYLRPLKPSAAVSQRAALVGHLICLPPSLRCRRHALAASRSHIGSRPLYLRRP